MRDYKIELQNRTEFIRDVLAKSGCHGIVYGNSGGKDSTLVGILCRKACRNVLGVIMPCSVKQNLQRDREDAILLARQFGIETITVDLGAAKEALCASARQGLNLSDAAKLNIAPRLRMTMLYAIAQSKNYLVAGTTNRSERHIGYFTKWGDGACDFNPVSDLTVREVYEFLRHLGALPSAPEPVTRHPREIAKAYYLNAGEGGCWYPQVKAGEKIAKGQLLGTVKDYFGKEIDSFYAEADGVVLYLTVSLAIKDKGSLIAYGELD